jgi:putative transposase
VQPPRTSATATRFTLSFREVEEMMLARGVVASYETIRRWWAKFGPV